MKFERPEIILIVAVVVIAALLYFNRGCTTCKNRYAELTGAAPGAGPGVMVRPEHATPGAQ